LAIQQAQELGIEEYDYDQEQADIITEGDKAAKFAAEAAPPSPFGGGNGLGGNADNLRQGNGGGDLANEHERLAGADELIKQLRRRLRDEYAFPKSPDGLAVNWGIQCVYSTEPAFYPQADGSCSTKREASAEPGQRLDCAAGFGASSMVTGTFGLTLAGLAVKQLITA
jgi:hypothetical protein